MEEVIRMEYGNRFESAFKDAMTSPEYWLEDAQFSFLDSILEAMDTKRVSRKELAERLGKSQAYVSKTLNAGALNFTLKTMVNLAFALDLKLSLALEDLGSTEAARWKSRPNTAVTAPVSWSALELRNNEPATKTEEPDGHRPDTLAA